MIRVGIVGVPGSGKTSLARSIVSKCRSIESLKRVELVSEYARRYISKHSEISEIWEQYRIMEKQIEWEDSIPYHSTDLLVTDSPIHLGFLYACQLVTNKSKDIMVYNDIFKKLSKLNEVSPRYSIIFHLPPTLPPVEDGIRPPLHFNESWRKEADLNIQFLFKSLFKPASFITLECLSMDLRVNKSLEEISSVLSTIL